MKTYPSDLTESQWQVIENIVDFNQRKRKYCLRNIMNALLYIAKSGIQWRMLPVDYAPWETVYYYFRKWKRDGLIEETHDILVEKVRIGIGKKPTPSVGIVDSLMAKEVYSRNKLYFANYDRKRKTEIRCSSETDKRVGKTT